MGNESAICQGCCLNFGFFEADYNPGDFPSTYNLAAIKLTNCELEILRKLGEAWGLYISLDNRSLSDNSEFLDAIHRAQQIIALRVARRVNPEVWAQPC